MFKFLKKNKSTQTTPDNIPVVEPVDVEAIQEKINAITLDGSPEVYLELARLYSEFDIDQAIKYYEECLSLDKTITSAQSELLKVYNVKRRELSSEGKVDEAMKYLDKIDNVMQQSKDSIRGL